MLDNHDKDLVDGAVKSAEKASSAAEKGLAKLRKLLEKAHDSDGVTPGVSTKAAEAARAARKPLAVIDGEYAKLYQQLSSLDSTAVTLRTGEMAQEPTSTTDDDDEVANAPEAELEAAKKKLEEALKTITKKRTEAEQYADEAERLTTELAELQRTQIGTVEGDLLSQAQIDRFRTITDHLAIYVQQQYGSITNQRKRVVTPVNMLRKIQHVADPDVRSQLVTLGFFDLGRVILGYTHTETPAGSGDGEIQALAKAADSLIHQTRSSTDHNWPLDANFCAFATWAAVTIGPSISNRFAPRRIDNDTPNMVRGLASRLAIDVRQTNGERLSRLLSEAQLKVFVQVLNALVPLLESSSDLEKLLDGSVVEVNRQRKANREELLDLKEIKDPAVALAVIDECERLLSSDARVALLVRDRPSGRKLSPHYQSLRHGMLSLLLARYAAKIFNDKVGPTVRTELIFRSTLLIESYIQTVVQTVLDYSVDELASDYLSDYVGIEESEKRGAGRWRRRFNRKLQAGFERRFDDVWGRFLTDQILVARIGDEVIRLGRDIPDPPGNQPGFFPKGLERVKDQWTNNLLMRFDHSFGTGVGTRSFYWANYDDRMNFMTNLFRSRQLTPGVWKEPFTLREEAQVRTGSDPTKGAALSWMR